METEVKEETHNTESKDFKNKNKSKKKIICILLAIIVVIMVIAITIIVLKKDKPTESTSKQIKSVTNQYVAYVKINPSIKLEYSQSCKGTDCKEPVVNSYELINEDAENIFKDIDLLANGADLSTVLGVICDKVTESGINFSSVEIYSNWNNLNSYLEKSAVEETWSYKTSVMEAKKIEKSITNDLEIEKDTKAKEKAEAEAKAKEEAEAKAKEEADAKEKAKIKEKEIASNPSLNNSNTANTGSASNSTGSNRSSTVIYLSDGVSYHLSGAAYCCVECFSDELIQELSSAKGYHVFNADSSTIDFRKIVELSSPYKSSTYFGAD